jgi:hypothetical protein
VQTRTSEETLLLLVGLIALPSEVVGSQLGLTLGHGVFAEGIQLLFIVSTWRGRLIGVSLTYAHGAACRGRHS